MAAIDVIEWRDVSGDEIVHRWPEVGPGNIRLGAQLTVRESQVAVFFRDGKALDVFQPGRHTLTTANLPLLQRLLNIPFGGKTPFQAEIYFVNMKVFTDLKWGTPSPIVFRDSELHTVTLRAYGNYTMRVQNPQLFVNTVVGTESRYDTESISGWMRDFIVARFNDTLGETMQTILDLPKLYSELSVAVKTRLREDFGRYGIELIDFLIQAVTPSEEVMQMIDERARMEVVGDMGRYTQFQTAQAIREMPRADGGNLAAMGAGMGAGVGIGATMAQAMREALSPGSPQPPAATPEAPATSPAGAKFCANCGNALPPNAKFCPECGTKVGS